MPMGKIFLFFQKSYFFSRKKKMGKCDSRIHQGIFRWERRDFIRRNNRIWRDSIINYKLESNLGGPFCLLNPLQTKGSLSKPLVNFLR